MPQHGVSENGAIILSTLTCPECGHSEELEMPENACIYFHTCSHCQTRLKPKTGDCCVFCSYGDVPCPPVQLSGKSCCASEW